MATFRTADVERERPDEDFTIECDSGRTYTLPHPRSVPGRDLLDPELDASPGGLLALMMGDSVFADFIDEPEIDGFALDQITRAWMAHYGMSTSLGNGRGSRPRSTATDRLSKRT